MATDSYYFTKLQFLINEHYPDIAIQMKEGVTEYMSTIADECDSLSYEMSKDKKNGFVINEVIHDMILGKLGFSYYDYCSNIYEENYSEKYANMIDSGTFKIKMAQFINANKDRIEELDTENKEAYYTVLGMFETKDIN